MVAVCKENEGEASDFCLAMASCRDDEAVEGQKDDQQCMETFKTCAQKRLELGGMT